MELKDSQGNYIVTQAEYEVLQELKKLAPVLKNRIFAIGRNIDELSKVMAKLGTSKTDIQ